MLQHRDCQLD